MGIFPGGQAQPAGDEGRGQSPREGTAVAERRLAQQFRQLFPLLLRLLGNHFSPSQTCPAGKRSPHGGFPPWQPLRRLSARWFPELQRSAFTDRLICPAKSATIAWGGCGGGRISRVGSEVGDARTGRTPTLLSRTTRGWEAASPRGGFGRFKATAASDPEATVTLQPPD